MGLKQAFDEKPVLSYGKDYVLNNPIDSPCNVESGDLFDRNGSLIQNKDGKHLVCTGEDGQKRCLNLNTGRLGPVPGGFRAAFGEWCLWLKRAEAMIAPAFVFPPIERAPPPLGAAR